VFSLDCTTCNYHKADVECQEQHEGAKYTFTVSEEKDLNIRVVKSSTATVKIPRVMTIEPGPASNGYITNVEGLLNRVKVQLEKTRDLAEDDEDRRKAKNLLKKVQAALWGHDTIDIIMEDPEGNSAILSEKAKKESFKGKKKE
jgi:zinc finger protein